MLDHVHILLVGTTHPGNIGSAARALKTMGLARLHLVAACAVDERARANAGNAGDTLAAARTHGGLDEALVGMGRVYGVTARRRRYGVPSLTPRRAAAEIAGAGVPVAMLFGREHSGLTNTETGRCHRLVHIPADPAYPSLNLAAAVQVLTYELRLAALAGEGTPQPEEAAAAADPAHLAGLYEHLSRVMAASGYAGIDEQRHLMLRLQRLFNRALPERAEVNILRGLLAAVERRLDADGRD
ncbi:RNA methyltransferase [Arhodomonas sp. SL1]|uniref:RNA methyltransferase n=1 Tax=Arhodomonas sp. SL1 TaxID=3425691 RepID=UPI003F884E4A